MKMTIYSLESETSAELDNTRCSDLGLQNCEKHISVVYKPSSLWDFVIAAQMDKDTHSNHTNRHFPTEKRPGERGDLSFYLTFFWCKAGHPCKCSPLAWWGGGTGSVDVGAFPSLDPSLLTPGLWYMHRHLLLPLNNQVPWTTLSVPVCR